MLNLVLFGPPGAGKGTQATRISEKYQLIHLSTGDILREEIAAETELGVEAKKNMDRGELVPDLVVINMIATKIDENKNANGFIFDGFPRSTAQAEALDTILVERGVSIAAMLALEVDNEHLMQRLLRRGRKSGRPDDQNPAIIGNRISIYNKTTAPVIDFYASQNKYLPVNGIGTIEEIFDRLCTSIDVVK